MYDKRSTTPQVSLIECIDNYGAPISIALIPAAEARIGPIVDPHIPSYLIIKSWSGTGGWAFAAITLNIAALTESVTYLWLAFILRTIPSWIFG